MRILSLFDGCSCGQVALLRAGHTIESYHASEIDRYAMAVTKNNFPDTIHVGNIQRINITGKYHFDLVMGGSPCQGFSVAGKRLNFEDPRSKLFFEFVRILDKVRAFNPDVLFLLENVRMKKEWRDIISGLLGIEPIEINSALVSAQNRRRLYWTNIQGITQPADRGLVLRDILETDGRGFIKDRGVKAMGVYANYHKGADNHGMRTMIAGMADDLAGHDINRRIFSDDGKSPTILSKNAGGAIPPKILQVNPSTESGGIQPYQHNRVYSPDGKMVALSAELGGRFNVLTAKDITRAKDEYSSKEFPSGHRRGEMQFPDKIDRPSKSLMGNNTTSHRETTHLLDGIHYRKLTPIECERLQGMPDDYTAGVSNTQRYKMIGNGWQIDTLAHIFSFIQ